MNGSFLMVYTLLLTLVWSPVVFGGEAIKGPAKSTFVVQ